MRWYARPIVAVAAALALLGTTVVAGAARQAAGRRLRSLDTTSGPVSYFVAEGSGQSGFRPADRQLALWAFAAWQRSAAGSLRFEPTPESDALVRLYWAGPQEGQYGEMRPLIVSGRHGAAVYIRPDMDALGPDIARRAAADPLLRDSVVYLTCVHELGHALGLEHTSDFRDIMYFFGYGGDILEFFGRYRTRLRTRADIAQVDGVSEADVTRLRSIYAPR
jgi:hypothetical protein